MRAGKIVYELLLVDCFVITSTDVIIHEWNQLRHNISLKMDIYFVENDHLLIPKSFESCNQRPGQFKGFWPLNKNFNRRWAKNRQKFSF